MAFMGDVPVLVPGIPGVQRNRVRVKSFHIKRLNPVVKGTFFHAAYGQTGLIGGCYHNAPFMQVK